MSLVGGGGLAASSGRRRVCLENGRGSWRRHYLSGSWLVCGWVSLVRIGGGKPSTESSGRTGPWWGG